MEISIVSPVYKAENIIDELVKRLTHELKKITEDYEIILINDRSPDNSWQKMVNQSDKDKRIKSVLLSKNFGQHHAITAGLDLAVGKWVVVMDCDLQDRPEEIINLYNEAMKGFDIVQALRVNRTDSTLKKLKSKLFNLVFSYLSGVKQDYRLQDFGIYSQKAIAVINTIREPMRSFSPLASWVGFSRSTVEVQHGQRFEGKSSYSLAKQINLAIDTAIAYSDKPLPLPS